METAPSAPPLPLSGIPVGADYLLPAEIAAACRTDHMTVLRWLNTGISTRSAEGKRVRVRLRGWKIGGRWKVPVAEFEAFVKATSGTAYHQRETETRETESQKRARLDRCLKRLTEMGLID